MTRRALVGLLSRCLWCGVAAPASPASCPGGAMTTMDAAHQTCPYSRATRGNIDVAISVV